MIHLSCFINSYKASQLMITNDIDVNVNDALIIIETIERHLADQHPHKQTTIDFK